MTKEETVLEIVSAMSILDYTSEKVLSNIEDALKRGNRQDALREIAFIDKLVECGKDE